jgi:hypothetical protein
MKVTPHPRSYSHRAHRKEPEAVLYAQHEAAAPAKLDSGGLSVLRYHRLDEWTQKAGACNDGGSLGEMSRTISPEEDSQTGTGGVLGWVA